MIGTVPVSSVSDILADSATVTTSSLITIPAGRYYSADISLTVTAPLAGTASASVTFTPVGTGAGPATTKVLARCTGTGLLSATANNNSYTGIFVYGGDSGAHLDYSAASSGASTCTINGFLM